MSRGWLVTKCSLFVLLTALVLGMGGAPSSARLMRARASSRTPLWVGTVTAKYSADGVQPNGNCPSCVSSSSEHATVTLRISRHRIRVSGQLQLKERVDYNSQCSGMAVRTELDTGVPARSLPHSGVSVHSPGHGKYVFAFSPPGIPYTGVISEEVTQVASNGRTISCSTGTHSSSGVFYIPAFDAPIVKTGYSRLRIHGAATHGPAKGAHCQVPRDTCDVTYSWSLVNIHSK
jgi:hypothetical protein